MIVVTFVYTGSDGVKDTVVRRFRNSNRAIDFVHGRIGYMYTIGFTALYNGIGFWSGAMIDKNNRRSEWHSVGHI